MGLVVDVVDGDVLQQGLDGGLESNWSLLCAGMLGECSNSIALDAGFAQNR